MNFQTRKLSDLKVYENNPRNNGDAVDKVKLSITKYGYKVPVVIDSNNYIVAGHTRLAALQSLNRETGQYSSISVILADDLDQNEINQFRIVDNQVASIAEWDFMKLTIELDGLDDFILSDFGEIEGFNPDLVLIEDSATESTSSDITISIGQDKITLSEAEYHNWCSYISTQKGISVLQFVKTALEIDIKDRRFNIHEV